MFLRVFRLISADSSSPRAFWVYQICVKRTAIDSHMGFRYSHGGIFKHCIIWKLSKFRYQNNPWSSKRQKLSSACVTVSTFSRGGPFHSLFATVSPEKRRGFRASILASLARKSRKLRKLSVLFNLWSCTQPLKVALRRLLQPPQLKL